MLEAKLESPGQNAQLSLDVTAGVGLNVLLQSTIQPCAVLTEILNPNGVIVASNGCGGGTSSLSLANPAVSGTYAVRIDPVGAWTTTTQVTVVGL